MFSTNAPAGRRGPLAAVLNKDRSGSGAREHAAGLKAGVPWQAGQAKEPAIPMC